MYYLNTEHLSRLDRDWHELATVIEGAVHCLDNDDFAQPIKPYLRYRNAQNRIIAMPAFVGGDINFSGIKWIASFPGNIHRGVKRAHSVSILNEADTGVPLCVINSPLISGIRTAAVTGLMIKKFREVRGKTGEMVVGMTGFGPIGQLHLEMVGALLGDDLASYKIFDLRPVEPGLIPAGLRSKVTIASSFEEAFSQADLFITATVASKPYLEGPPKPGSLHLNISLRDYKTEFMDAVDVMVVDDWEEVCREQTDIERMHLEKGLQKEDTVDLKDVFCRGTLEGLSPEAVVMFNPMGMAVFDIAVGAHYYKKAQANEIGVCLEDG